MFDLAALRLENFCMGNLARPHGAFGLTVALCAGVGCSGGASNSAATQLPLLTPPVRAATPPALGGTGVNKTLSDVAILRSRTEQQPATTVQRKLFALDSADLKSRFFAAGPTSIFRILEDVDGRIEEINRGSRHDAPCLTQEPVPYQLTPFGQRLTFYAQCFRSFAGVTTDGSFFQFGLKDGVAYLYAATGAEHVAARITPVGDTASDGGVFSSGKYSVDAWIGVGYNNATSCSPMAGFDRCSYGVIELHTDESRLGLELTVAGVGFGYCGAQLKSDGSHVFAIGSSDMGESCLTTSTLCVAASDVTTPEVCNPQLTKFSAPALGRLAVSGSSGLMGPSLYPGKADNQIVLNGSASDSLGFGPSVPSPGVGELSTGVPRETY